MSTRRKNTCMREWAKTPEGREHLEMLNRRARENLRKAKGRDGVLAKVGA